MSKKRVVQVAAALGLALSTHPALACPPALPDPPIPAPVFENTVGQLPPEWGQLRGKPDMTPERAEALALRRQAGEILERAKMKEANADAVDKQVAEQLKSWNTAETVLVGRYVHSVGDGGSKMAIFKTILQAKGNNSSKQFALLNRIPLPTMVTGPCVMRYETSTEMGDRYGERSPVALFFFNVGKPGQSNLFEQFAVSDLLNPEVKAHIMKAAAAKGIWPKREAASPKPPSAQSSPSAPAPIAARKKG